MKRLSFTARVALAMVAAVVVGLAMQTLGFDEWPERFLSPVGRIFLNLIRFIVCPLVLFSVMGGIVSMNDAKKVGLLGAKTVGCFLLTTLVAVCLSLAVGMSVRGIFPILKDLASAGGGSVVKTANTSLTDAIVGIFPDNFARPFIDANMLQVIVMAVFFGLAIILLGGQAKSQFESAIGRLNALCVKTLELVMAFSPIGVFCLMCPVVTANGPKVLGSLVNVLAVVYGCYAFHLVFVDAVLIRLVTGIPVGTFLRRMMPAITFAFSSSSSVGSLPVNMACAEKLGVPHSVASFVLPLGATINMNGTVIYHGVSAVFVAACYGISLNVEQLVAIALTSTLASIGTAGAPGAGIVMLTMVLSAAGLPLEGIALVAGVDRLFDMGRTVLNIVGDTTAGLLISVRRAH